MSILKVPVPATAMVPSVVAMLSRAIMRRKKGPSRRSAITSAVRVTDARGVAGTAHFGLKWIADSADACLPRRAQQGLKRREGTCGCACACRCG